MSLQGKHPKMYNFALKKFESRIIAAIQSEIGKIIVQSIPILQMKMSELTKVRSRKGIWGAQGDSDACVNGLSGTCRDST